jgi:predicted phage baseplate assembly protein
LTKLIASVGVTVSVTQPVAALGGRAAEELDEAIGRALTAQETPTRAVTSRDFEDLVLAMPGVPVARVFAIADYHPDMPCLPALGCVTVVVVPRCPAGRPEPTAELLLAVARYLERRRVLTTEVHVVGPCYATVSVQAQLHTAAGFDRTQLVSHARTALARCLDPLRGGEDGSGWPIGRDVYRAEILALLQDLPGVDHVDQVALQMDDGVSARCGNSSVCRHGLVASGAHQITIATRTLT